MRSSRKYKLYLFDSYSHLLPLSARFCCEDDVCLSVLLVDCDHIVQQKVEMGTRQIGRCFIRYLHAKADQDCIIL